MSRHSSMLIGRIRESIIEKLSESNRACIAHEKGTDTFTIGNDAVLMRMREMRDAIFARFEDRPGVNGLFTSHLVLASPELPVERMVIGNDDGAALIYIVDSREIFLATDGIEYAEGMIIGPTGREIVATDFILDSLRNSI